MKKSLVLDWMSRGVVSIAPKTTVEQAVALMKKNKIRMLPVTTGQLIVGVVSDRDLKAPKKAVKDPNVLKNFPVENLIPVEFLMTPKVVTVTQQDHIATAANLIVKHKIGGLPVVDKAGSSHIVGVITSTDLLKAFLALMDLANW